MGKRFFIVLLVAVLLLCGCSKRSCVTIRSIENSNSHSFSMRYQKFDGSKEYTLQAKEERQPLKVSVVTEAGSLSMTIGEKGKDPVYTGTDMPDMDFTVYLDPGKYIITLTAEDHRGSYSFDWGE